MNAIRAAFMDAGITRKSVGKPRAPAATKTKPAESKKKSAPQVVPVLSLVPPTPETPAPQETLAPVTTAAPVIEHLYFEGSARFRLPAGGILRKDTKGRSYIDYQLQSNPLERAGLWVALYADAETIEHIDLTKAIDAMGTMQVFTRTSCDTKYVLVEVHLNDVVPQFSINWHTSDKQAWPLATYDMAKSVPGGGMIAVSKVRPS